MPEMINTPSVKLGVVGVSRDCFPRMLTERRLNALMASLKRGKVVAERSPVIIETETDALAAVEALLDAGCNAAVIYLGNFGPEGPTTIFAENFPGPVMVCAAAEESKAVLATDRGDALCGLLNCSYNLGLRRLPAYIPEYPVGTPEDLVADIRDFMAVARVVIGVKSLKIFAFGPRPQDFLACHGPIQPLYDLGVEVMENSELDLLQCYRKAATQTKAIKAIAQDMARELGKGNTYPKLLPKLAQFEVALMDFFEANLGASAFGVFADKCWPAFEFEFGFVPCYVNSRLAGRGIPVACEVDIYGALSEYMVQLASLAPATLLDINNSVPKEMIKRGLDLGGATVRDLFMGFHCGNTCAECMESCALKYQLIMNRLMEGGQAPDITRGTLEGPLKAGPTTMFRLQATPDNELRSYLAEGQILKLDPCSFGGIGVIAIPGFARFYRHILVGRHFPHHGAFGFRQVGKILFDAATLLGIEEINVPRPPHSLYPGENPFAG